MNERIMDLLPMKRPLRIGFSALLTEGGRSGIGQYIIQLLGSLQENDATNRYVIFALKGDPSLDHLTSERFTVVRIPGIFARPVPSILWHWFVLPILARRWRLELLHLPSTRRPCPLSPCPTVITVHDLAVLRISGKYGPFRHLYIWNVARGFLRRSAHIIAVSKSTRYDLLAFARLKPNRLSVVHQGVDHKRFCPLDREYCQAKVTSRYGIRSPFILCVSRLEHPGKNLVRLIEAFAQLKREAVIPHQLVMVGAPWNGAKVIYQAAKSSDFASEIFFPGFISSEDLPLFYNAADVFVLPSLWEGFGFPLLEAMACGVPMACSDRGSLPEVGRESVLYFDPYDPKSIRGAVLSLISPPALEKINGHKLSSTHRRGYEHTEGHASNESHLKIGEPRQALISKGLKRAGQFSWDETALRTLEIYHEATEGCGTGDQTSHGA